MRDSMRDAEVEVSRVSRALEMAACRAAMDEIMDEVRALESDSWTREESERVGKLA